MNRKIFATGLFVLYIFSFIPNAKSVPILLLEDNDSDVRIFDSFNPTDIISENSTQFGFIDLLKITNESYTSIYTRYYIQVREDFPLLENKVVWIFIMRGYFIYHVGDSLEYLRENKELEIEITNEVNHAPISDVPFVELHNSTTIMLTAEEGFSITPEDTIITYFENVSIFGIDILPEEKFSYQARLVIDFLLIMIISLIAIPIIYVIYNAIQRRNQAKMKRP